MTPVFVALFLTLALAAFGVAVLVNGPDRWRAPLTWVAVGLGLWLLPAWWNAFVAA